MKNRTAFCKQLSEDVNSTLRGTVFALHLQPSIKRIGVALSSNK